MTGGLDKKGVDFGSKESNKKKTKIFHLQTPHVPTKKESKFMICKKNIKFHSKSNPNAYDISLNKHFIYFFFEFFIFFYF